MPSNQPSAAELKKLAIGGRKPADQPSLYIAEHDGELYATNSYWLVPVARVAPLLHQYNLPTDQPGSFTVNGAVTPRDQEPPRISGLIPTADLYELERVQVAGLNAYAKADMKGHWLALFTSQDVTVAFAADFLTFMTGDSGSVTIRQAKPAGPAVFHDGDRFAGLLMPVRLPKF